MRKLLLLSLILLIVLAACGSDSVVKNEKFTISEDEFIKVYEEVNDKNFPTNILVNEELLNIDFANKDEVIAFLDAAYEIIKDDGIRRLKNSIEIEENHINAIIVLDDISIFYNDEIEDSLSVSIYPFEFENE